MSLPSVLWGFIIFVVESFLAAPLAFAAISVSVANVPASVDQSQNFDVDVTLACPSCSSDSFLRAVFYPSGTSYFGYTQNNNGDWTNAPGGNCTQYFKVGSADLSKEGTWSGKLRVKVDTGSPYYNNPGDYLFKVGRYTTSCSSTWSQESTITVTGPSPTPTLTPSPTPTNTPTSTLTMTPTNTPTFTPTVTPKAVFIDAFDSSSSTQSSFDAVSAPSVLGASSAGKMQDMEASPSSSMKPIIISITFVALGLAILSGTMVWRLRNASSDPTREE